MAQLGLVQNLVIRWHHFQCLQSWPPGCITCIATLPWIALWPVSLSIELVSSSARVTSVKFHKGLGGTHGVTFGPIDRTPGLPGSDKKQIYGFYNCRVQSSSTHQAQIPNHAYYIKTMSVFGNPGNLLCQCLQQSHYSPFFWGWAQSPPLNSCPSMPCSSCSCPAAFESGLRSPAQTWWL